MPSPSKTGSNPPIDVLVPVLLPRETEVRIVTGTWFDEYHLAVAYVSLHPETQGPEITAAARPPTESASPPLQWLEYDVITATSKPIPCPLPIDLSFWQRNHIRPIADYPELYGYFSPSGRKVFYNVWHGSVFDTNSSTDIFLQDTDRATRTRLFMFAYSNVYIYKAEWNSTEDTVFFAATYEGPAQVYVADLTSARTASISTSTDWDGVTEDTFSLSPNDDRLAAVNEQSQLILVSLHDGSLAIAADAFASTPTWVRQGAAIYYWHGSDWTDTTELRSFDTRTFRSTRLFDASALATSLHALGFELSPSDEVNLLGGMFAVAPSAARIFLPSTPVGPIIIDLDSLPGA